MGNLFWMFSTNTLGSNFICHVQPGAQVPPYREAVHQQASHQAKLGCQYVSRIGLPQNWS